MVMPFYQERRPECKNESFFTTEKQKKTDFPVLMATALPVKQYLKLWVATIPSAPAKKPVHLCLSKEEKRSDKWMSKDESF